MKRFVGVLSLIIALAVASTVALAAQHTLEKLSNKQLVALIATANTKADHMRLAHYYRAKAQDFLMESKEHEASAEAYKKNPIVSGSKFKTATIDHCDYFTKSLQEDAVKMNELAEMHEAMATGAK